MRMRKIVFAGLTTLLFAFSAQQAPAGTVLEEYCSIQPKVTEIAKHGYTAFVGNSFFYYNNGMQSMATKLAQSLPTPVKGFSATLIAISGSGQNWHDMESYFRPNAIGSTAFNPDNTIRTKQYPEGKLFDVVIMLDNSQGPIHPQLGPIFQDFAARHAKTIRTHDAEPVLFMSWAYADKPEMTKQLAEAYTDEANKNNMLVIPAGLAFAKAKALKPDIVLHAKDNRHPSYAGSYLSAATTVAALYGVSPVDATFNGDLPADTARFLRQVAWDTVREFFGK